MPEIASMRPHRPNCVSHQLVFESNMRQSCDSVELILPPGLDLRAVAVKGDYARPLGIVRAQYGVVE